MTTTTARTRFTPADLAGSPPAVPVYVDSVSGNDNNSGLVSTAPLRTNDAAGKLLRSLDLGDQNVTVFCAPGTTGTPKVYDAITPLGRLVGRSFNPIAVRYLGNPAQPNTCIIRPALNTDAAVHLEDDQTLYVEGFRFDMTNNPGVPSVIVENGCLLGLGNNTFGPCPGSFHIQTCFGAGKVIFNSSFSLDMGSTVSQAFLQLDPNADAGSSCNGVWGQLFAAVIGTPVFSNAFMMVDGAKAWLNGLAFLQASTIAQTTLGSGGGTQGSYTFQVNNPAGISNGLFVYSGVTLYGSQVTGVSGNTVTLNVPLQANAPAGTAITFGAKAVQGSASGSNLARSFNLTNGGKINTGTNVTGTLPDYWWLPHSGAYGVTDGDPGSRYV